MNRPTFFLIAAFLLISTGTALAGTTTLTTYYPAPGGNYDKMVVNTSLGVGTTATNAKLQVLNAAGIAAIFDTSSATPNANSGIRIVAPISTTHFNWMIAAQQNVDAGFEITPSTAVGGTTFNTPAITILRDGTVKASAFLYSSDQRLKQNIHPLTHALEKIQRLNGVRFTWKKNDAKDIGVIAQNVEKVLPELVKTDEDGMKSVAYGNLTALLIEAVKEQQKQIEDLKKQVARLQHKQSAH